MRQIKELLEAYEAAVQLYPSSSAAAVDHPQLFAPALLDRFKVSNIYIIFLQFRTSKGENGTLIGALCCMSVRPSD